MSLSIVTAAAPWRADHILETADSVQKLRESATLQWIVIWDGSKPMTVNGIDFESEGRPRSGISCTRNLALAHINSDYVMPLDADDLVVADGVLAGLKALEDNPNLGWVGLSRTFLDGSPTKHTLTEGRYFKAGELSENWTAPFLFHPNSFIARTSLVKRAGGWPAIATNEDLGLVLALSELSDGAVIPEVLTRYRVWDKQEVAKPSYPAMKKLAFDYIESVVNELRKEKDRLMIVAPEAPGGAFGRGRKDQR